MSQLASASSALPSRVQAYVETIVHTCADGGRALVSVVLFGSAAIGGWVETVSDVDLILVVPDCATDEDTERLRREVERIEIVKQMQQMFYEECAYLVAVYTKKLQAYKGWGNLTEVPGGIVFNFTRDNYLKATPAS